MDGHRMADEFEDRQVRDPVGQGPGARPIDALRLYSLEQGVELHPAVREDARLAAGELPVGHLDVVPDEDVRLEPLLELFDQELQGPRQEDDAAALALEAEDLGPQVFGDRVPEKE